MTKTSRQVIEERMGSDFLDAIYEGTTDLTLVAPFADAMEEIARRVTKEYVTREEALSILIKKCPDGEYNPRMFINAFPLEANERRWDVMTMERATPEDIARIWEQLWGVSSLPTSNWAMLEDGELLDLTQQEK